MNILLLTVCVLAAIFPNLSPVTADPPFSLYQRCVFCTDYNRQTFQVDTDNQNVWRCGGPLSTSYRAVEFSSKEQCSALYRPYGPQYTQYQQYQRPATIHIQRLSGPTPYQQCLYCTGQRNVFLFQRRSGQGHCSSFVKALPTLFFANGGAAFWQRGECNRLGRPF